MKRVIPSWILALWAVAIIGAGCSMLTVTPKIVEPAHASLEGNTANSGVFGRLQDGSYALSAQTVTNYNHLINQGYGKGFITPLQPFDGTRPMAGGTYPLQTAKNGPYVPTLVPNCYAMDDEHVTDFGMMLAARRSAQP